MFDLFLAEMLSLLMICLTCLRIFFTKRARIDPIAILAPLSFVTALCSLCIWGMEPFLLLIAALSLLVLLTNVRALFRLYAQLYVDHYSILFISFSLFELIAALAIGGAAVFFHPVQYRVGDFGVTKQVQYLTGTLANGYYVRGELFEPSKITGRLYTYTPAENVPQNPIVLFVPKSTASAVHYEPYFMLLAQKGYTVLSADFYANTPRLYETKSLISLDSRLFRRAHSVRLALSSEEASAEKTAREKRDAANTAASYDALTKIALAHYGSDKRLFYAVDSLSMELLNPLVTQHEENVLGFFALNRVAEYTTTGFGFVEQTDPYTAYRLNAHRDKTFFIPRYVAGKTDEVIQDMLKLLHPVEIIRKNESK